MEISGTSSQINDYIRQSAKVEEAEALYQVKLMKMQQESEQVIGTLLEDTAEISQEAMQKYIAEIKGQFLYKNFERVSVKSGTRFLLNCLKKFVYNIILTKGKDFETF